MPPLRRAAPLVLLLFGMVPLEGCFRAGPASELTVEIVPASQAHPARVRVSGFSSDEVRDLRSAAWDEAAWQRLLRVSVEAAAETAVAGRYHISDRAIEFQPAFPFDPGRAYQVHLDSSRLPTPRAGGSSVTKVALPGVDAGPPVEVSRIDPSADVWPENLLRFYIHFSGPMARRAGLEHVRLIDEGGGEVGDALLESPVDFWSPDQRRLTVFFDPGRVKTDLVPNAELGRAMVAGRRYTIVVDAAWTDAHGRPLRESYRRTFRAGPAVAKPIALADWRLSVPDAGSRDPLVVTMPWSLDRALLERTLGVASEGEAIAGRVDVTNDETEWRFVPAAPWSAAPHDLVVLSVLEDPQGNLIGQPFEVDPDERTPGAPRPERYTIPFALRATGIAGPG